MSRQKLIFYICLAVVVLIGGSIYRFSDRIENLLPTSQDVAFKQKQLAKYQALVSQRKQIESYRVALNRALERAEAGLLTGETRALAAVDIQNLLNNIGNQSGVDIKSMRVLESRPVGAEKPEDAVYLRIPIQAIIVSDIRRIKEMLYRIEGYPKLLEVENLRLRVTNSQKPEQIYVTLTLAGFMKQGKQRRKS